MSSLFSKPDIPAPIVQEAVKPTTENLDRKKKEEEMRLLKKKGRSSTMLASSDTSRKTVLGG